MKPITKRLVCFCVTVTIFIFGCSDEHTTNEEAPDYKNIQADFFSIEIPYVWRQIRGSELSKYRQQLQGQISAQGQALGNFGSNDFKVTDFKMFATEYGEEVGVFITKVTLPSSLAEHYLQTLYDSTKAQIESRFKSVHKHDITVINGVPVMLSDVETATGARLKNFTFQAMTDKNSTTGLMIMVAPGEYRRYETQIDHLIESFRINNQGEVTDAPFAGTLAVTVAQTLEPKAMTEEEIIKQLESVPKVSGEITLDGKPLCSFDDDNAQTWGWNTLYRGEPRPDTWTVVTSTPSIVIKLSHGLPEGVTLTRLRGGSDGGVMVLEKEPGNAVTYNLRFAQPLGDNDAPGLGDYEFGTTKGSIALFFRCGFTIRKAVP